MTSDSPTYTADLFDTSVFDVVNNIEPFPYIFGIIFMFFVLLLFFVVANCIALTFMANKKIKKS